MIQGMVSFIIPCFNAEKWIVQTIGSALNQCYSNKEIIVNDDCSTDESVSAIVDSSPYVRLFFDDDRKNHGQSSALNLGIKHARGEFVAFLEADDLWAKDKL